LLPDYLRPARAHHIQKPREHRGELARPRAAPKEGGPIPREVRWPDWTIDRILQLADEFRKKHGKWPNGDSGRVSDSSPDTWTGIDIALARGNRNLPGGTSLAKLLAECRGVRNQTNMPPLTIHQILEWADDHHARTGTWPTRKSGPVLAAQDETWELMDKALRRGYRTLPSDSSLPRLLFNERGVYCHLLQNPLTVEQILEWADAHFIRTGQWPTANSGAIPEAPGLNWKIGNESTGLSSRGIDPCRKASLLPESSPSIVQSGIERRSRHSRTS
jgi:hypothetical protein